MKNNLYPEVLYNRFRLEPQKITGVILHFVGIDKDVKPWKEDNFFNNEWKDNLRKANNINLEKLKRPKKYWSKFDIYSYLFKLKLKFILNITKDKLLTNQYINITKLKIKNNFPFLYRLTKRVLKKSRFFSIILIKLPLISFLNILSNASSFLITLIGFQET